MKTVTPTSTLTTHQEFLLTHNNWFYRQLSALFVVKSVYQASNQKGQKAILLALLLPGLGRLQYGLFENLIVGVFLALFNILYLSLIGFKQLFGLITSPVLPLWLIPLLFIVIYLVYLFITFSATVVLVDEVNHQRPLPLNNSLESLKKVKKSVNSTFKVSGHTYRNGTKQTRFRLIIGYVLPSLPFYLRKQSIKATTTLLVNVMYFIYMIVVGAQSFSDMLNLSSFIGDRRPPLVYGVITIIFTLFMVFSYISSQLSNLSAENALLNNRKILTFKEEVESFKNDQAHKIMLFIPIIGAILFTIIPLVFMISLAFTNYNIAAGMGITKFFWTGISSFQKLFDGGTNFTAFINVFSWTMVWAFFATFTCYFGGFFLALLISKKTVKWKKFYRSLFVIAMAIPQFVSLRVLYSMFHDYGPINSILTSLGATRVLFWSNVDIAKSLIILINMWVGIPYFMLLISGLLLNIPKDYYEAAEIDGAGKFKIFAKITFPYILFSTTPLLITKFVDNINNFNVIWLLTNGGPMGQGTGGVAGGTDIFITWLYKLTMYDLNVAQYDIGAAIGIIMFIISSVLSLMIFRNTGAYKKESEFRK